MEGRAGRIRRRHMGRMEHGTRAVPPRRFGEADRLRPMLPCAVWTDRDKAEIAHVGNPRHLRHECRRRAFPHAKADTSRRRPGGERVAMICRVEDGKHICVTRLKRGWLIPSKSRSERRAVEECLAYANRFRAFRQQKRPVPRIE